MELKRPHGFLFLFLIASILQSELRAQEKITATEADLLPVQQMVIIGSGVAGLTAAIYAARGDLDPIIIEGESGGMLMNAGPIENWPGQPHILGPDLVANIRSHAEFYGARFLPETAVKVDFSQQPFTIWTDGGHEIKTMTVIIATGIMPEKIGVPGEDEYWGKGIAVCTLCDGPLYADRPVAVVGDGDLAMWRAIFLTKYASSIALIISTDDLVCSPSLEKRIRESEKITIVPHTKVTKVYGDDQGVTGVTIKDIKTNEQKELPVEGVFVAIGFVPDTDIFKGQVDLDHEGYILVRNYAETSVRGVFVGGTCASHGYKPAITASGTGAMAAVDAEVYLDALYGQEPVKHTFCSPTCSKKAR